MKRRGGKCSPERTAWYHMIRRCYNPKFPKFYLWGGRGITVCDKWRYDFEAFRRDIGPRPGKGFSIDRINRDGNYEPGNVRWADIFTQNRNRRPPRKPLPKTHCKRGHELSGSNLYVVPGGRHCKACKIMRQREYRSILVKKVPHSKLTDEQVLQIREHYTKSGKMIGPRQGTRKHLAEKFGVNKGAITLVGKRRSFKRIPEKE